MSARLHNPHFWIICSSFLHCNLAVVDQFKHSFQQIKAGRSCQLIPRLLPSLRVDEASWFLVPSVLKIFPLQTAKEKNKFPTSIETGWSIPIWRIVFNEYYVSWSRHTCGTHPCTAIINMCMCTIIMRAVIVKERRVQFSGTCMYLLLPVTCTFCYPWHVPSATLWT